MGGSSGERRRMRQSSGEGAEEERGRGGQGTMREVGARVAHRREGAGRGGGGGGGGGGSAGGAAAVAGEGRRWGGASTASAHLRGHPPSLLRTSADPISRYHSSTALTGIHLHSHALPAHSTSLLPRSPPAAAAAPAPASRTAKWKDRGRRGEARTEGGERAGAAAAPPHRTWAT